MSLLPLLMLVMMPMLLILWNKNRCKGRMLCVILRKDKSVITKLCELRDDFVIWDNRAYDVYPDYVRLTWFPSGWPSMFQEAVPSCLYLEEDAIPLNWIDLDNRLERSMELKSALDENWLRKLVHDAAQETGVGGGGLKWRKILPIGLLIVGLIGLGVIMFVKPALG